jgi:phosphoglycolate phosphatase
MKIPLFDIDNTLLEAGNKAHTDALNYAMQTIYNQPTAFMREIKVDGMIDTQIIIEVLKLHGMNENNIKVKMPEALRAMDTYFSAHEHKGKSIILPGVVELLTELRNRHIPMELLTGNIETIAWRKLALAGLKGFFSFGAFGSSAYKRVKLISMAVERANEKGIHAQREDFVIIGDSPLDVACAKEGGIQSIAVATGNFSIKELKNTGADLVIATCNEKDKVLRFLQVA